MWRSNPAGGYTTLSSGPTSESLRSSSATPPDSAFQPQLRQSAEGETNDADHNNADQDSRNQLQPRENVDVNAPSFVADLLTFLQWARTPGGIFMGAMMPGDVVSFGANTLGVYPPTTQVWAVDPAATSRVGNNVVFLRGPFYELTLGREDMSLSDRRIRPQDLPRVEGRLLPDGPRLQWGETRITNIDLCWWTLHRRWEDGTPAHHLRAVEWRWGSQFRAQNLVFKVCDYPEVFVDVKASSEDPLVGLDELVMVLRSSSVAEAVDGFLREAEARRGKEVTATPLARKAGLPFGPFIIKLDPDQKLGTKFTLRTAGPYYSRRGKPRLTLPGADLTRYTEITSQVDPAISWTLLSDPPSETELRWFPIARWDPMTTSSWVVKGLSKKDPQESLKVVFAVKDPAVEGRLASPRVIRGNRWWE